MMRRSAVISDCGRFRYSLSRTWVEPGHEAADTFATFIMLNPSTADAEVDDPTIRRCIGFAKAWGLGGLMVVNLFAWRATSPRDLYSDPENKIGAENDRHIIEACGTATNVIAAWGNHGALLGRGNAVRSMIDDLEVLGLTTAGHPAHPLYLPGSLMPTRWGRDHA